MENLSNDDKTSLIKLIREKVEKRLGVPEKAVIRAAVDCAKSNLSKKSTAKELATLVDKDLSETIADDLENIITSFLKKVKSKSLSRKRKALPEKDKKLEKDVDKKLDNNKLDKKLDNKLDNKLDKKLDNKLDKKLNNKLDKKLDYKLDKKLEKKLDNKKNLHKKSHIVESDKKNDNKNIQNNVSKNKNEINSVLENLKKQIEIRKKSLADAVLNGKMVTLKDMQMKYLDQLSGKSQQAILMQQKIQETLTERIKNSILKNDDSKIDTLNSNNETNNNSDSIKFNEKNYMKSSHYDTRVKASGFVRKPPKSLNFHLPGKFISLANNIRTQEKLEKLQQKIQTTAKKTGIASAAKLAMVTMRHDAEPHNIPIMEWWDAAVLPYQSYNSFIADLKQVCGDVFQLRDRIESITNLIEHPIEHLPPDDSKDIHMPLYLTKKEQKKIRTQRRRAKEIEKQEKIRVGLEPPPPPKVKLSSLMRILGSEAVQDPTKVEAHVREQIAARLRAHEMANSERKLTPEAKRIKKIKKLKEDTSLGVYISVYRIWDLSNPSRKFKVDVNAQQLYMTGCVLLIQDMNLVILEGGSKSQAKMKRLLLNRIKWHEDVIGQCATHADRQKPKDENSQRNKCELVWEGINSKKSFQDFKIKLVVTDTVAREFLKKHNCEHFWDLAYTLSLDNDIKKS